MNKLNNFASRGTLRAFAALSAVALVLGYGQAAQADAITDGITAGQTALTGYVVAGIAAVVAILLLGVGVTVVVKFLRKAARAA